MSKLVISNSMLRSLQTCSTQSWLRTKGYSTSGSESTPAKAGRDAHEVLELWGRGNYKSAIYRFDDLYKPYSDKFLLEKDRYHHENLRRILDVFMSANPISTLPYEIVETEKQIECRLGTFDGVDFVVSDKSDGLVRMKDTDDIWSLEYKTVSYIGPDYVLDYELDSQISTHVEAWRQNGVDVKGVVLQAIQFSKLPDPNATTHPKKGEPKPASCHVVGHGKVRDCWTQHVKYERFMFSREEEHLQMWRRNALETMFDYYQVVQIEPEFINSVKQEGIFGHCGRCEFLQFCKGHRRNFDALTIREREEGVLYSGFYE